MSVNLTEKNFSTPQNTTKKKQLFFSLLVKISQWYFTCLVIWTKDKDSSKMLFLFCFTLFSSPPQRVCFNFYRRKAKFHDTLFSNLFVTERWFNEQISVCTAVLIKDIELFSKQADWNSHKCQITQTIKSMEFIKYDWKMLQIIYTYHLVVWLFYSNKQAVNSKNTICFVKKI